ncbi:glycosyltransferase family 2 protein [Candidatus Marinimicrobia bacterium]|nr:glycosyltransferase family 2 protein [Candidatus Neomarinimicrobiota bacterium]|tara:strand:- start:908 stop:1828 length:921 start_codon:yes stop_codon:yes gene_type:complete
MKISVVIPVFNEQESIKELYMQISAALKNQKKYEIIFINDGSSDKSEKAIIDLSNEDKRVKLISFYRNFGKSAALSEGFKYASGEIIITMDADLQDDPNEIPNLINKLDEGYDLVSGWKQKRYDPWTKTFPSKIFNFVTRVLTGVKIHDFNCGLKAYRSSVIKSIEVFGGRHRYIPALAGQMNFSVSEIVVNHRPRIYGETKYGGSRIFHGFFDLLTILFLNKYTQQPLHFFGSIGLATFIAGFFVELMVIYYKFVLLEPFSKHIALLLLGVILIIIGIQFFSIGLLGEIIARFSQGKEDRIKDIK